MKQKNDPPFWPVILVCAAVLVILFLLGAYCLMKAKEAALH